MEFYREKFRQIRKLKKMSMQELADKANISRVSVSIWERGVREPDERYIRLLANVLDISVNEISNLEPDHETSKLELSEFTETWLSFIEKDNIHQDRISDMLNGIKILSNELSQVKVILRALMSTLNSVLYLKDKYCKYITANDAFLKNLSLLSNFRVLGKKDQDLFPVKEAKKNEEEDHRVIASGEAIINEECFIPGTRKKKIGLKSKIPVFDEEGGIVGLLGLYTDITKLKDMEKHRQLLEAFLNNATDCLCIYQLKPFKTLYLSNSYSKVFGYSRDNFINDNFFRINNCVHPDDRDYELKYRVLGKYPGYRKYKIIKPDKTQRVISATTFELKFDGIKYLGSISRDITEISTLRTNRELLLSAKNALNKTILWGGIFDRDKKDIIFNFASDNVRDITGYSSDFIKTEKMSMLNFVPSQFHNLYYSWMERIETSPVFEHWFQNKSGELIWCETRITVKEKDGVLSCIGTSTALEKDDKAKKELMESQQVTIAFYVKEKTIEIAKNLKINGIDNIMIAESTGLSIDEIEKLH